MPCQKNYLTWISANHISNSITRRGKSTNKIWDTDCFKRNILRMLVWQAPIACPNKRKDLLLGTWMPFDPLTLIHSTIIHSTNLSNSHFGEVETFVETIWEPTFTELLRLRKEQRKQLSILFMLNGLWESRICQQADILFQILHFWPIYINHYQSTVYIFKDRKGAFLTSQYRRNGTAFSSIRQRSHGEKATELRRKGNGVTAIKQIHSVKKAISEQSGQHTVSISPSFSLSNVLKS